MSQPFNRAAEVPLPRPLDDRLGEFWVTSPWRIHSEGHNLSAYERNRTYLNDAGRMYYDISTLTGADSDGDGRSVVGADIDGDGREDLVVRQAGGGALLLFENRFPQAHWLTVSLRGTASNSRGVGAQLVAEVGDRRILREMFPVNGFRAVGPARVHFGLGEADTVDRLIIRWPSGREQVLEDVGADRHLVVTEDRDQG